MCPSDRHPRGGGAASPDLRPAFDVLDADHDGRISRDDLKAFFSSAASPLTEDDIVAMISAADADRNGFVDYDEFERVLGRRSRPRRRSSCGGGGSAGPRGGVMEEAFRVMDRDGDGKVGFEDLRAYLEWAGIPACDDDVRAMIRIGGGDGADGVCLDALARILAVDLA